MYFLGYYEIKEDHRSEHSFFLLQLVVLASADHQLQLICYHLLASLLVRRQRFFLLPLLGLGPATAAQGVTHLLMRAAFDFSLTPCL